MVFGEQAFLQYQLLKQASAKEKLQFSEKILNHGAVQKCLGQVTLTGLRRLDYKVTVELLPDAKGPRQSPGDYSMRDILMKMKAGSSWLWQGILLNQSGTYNGFSPGTDPVATEQAIEFAEDPGGTIKCFLVRQGWRIESIKKLICKSFDKVPANMANLAKWDKKRNKVISGAAKHHADHNARLDASFIDRTLGRTSYEIKAQQELEAKASAASAA